jgi:hypothetical protein
MASYLKDWLYSKNATPSGEVLLLTMTNSLITHRAVACGHNREMAEKPSVWLVYPNQGSRHYALNLLKGWKTR